ncbi:MAG: hypothetical protein Q8P22_06285 [Chloroflexota bacterium]|nr:hypothetical protein [Chloroflexota bacterium]
MDKNASSPNARRRIRFFAPLLLAAAVALTVWMVTSILATYEPQAEIILSDYTSGAHADLTSKFKIPEGNVLFDSVITFHPPEWGIASDDDVRMALRWAR